MMIMEPLSAAVTTSKAPTTGAKNAGTPRGICPECDPRA